MQWMSPAITAMAAPLENQTACCSSVGSVSTNFFHELIVGRLSEFTGMQDTPEDRSESAVCNVGFKSF